METKKSNKADLEIKRNVFLQVGLIISLSAALTAFEWKSPLNHSILLPRVTGNTDVEFIDIIPPDPPKPKPAPPSFTTLEVVDNTQLTDEYEPLDAGTDESEEIPEYIPPKATPLPDEKQVVEPDAPYISVEKMPEFPGGEKAMLEFLAKNIRFPEIARESNISGKVYLSFIVEKDGSISNIKILRAIGGGCEEEASRVISLMPRWVPGYQQLKPVRVTFNIPIEFKLRD